MNEQDVQSAKGAVQSLMVADTGLSLADLATVFVKSGFFKDIREQAQAIVKVLVGQELGIKPLQAMMSIHIVEGKPELSAGLLGALVKRSGRYDFRTVEHTDTACELEFFAVTNGTRESLGTSRFTMEDAARAGLANRNVWKSYPRNMLHARALSNGVRWHCMDALGLPVYIEGEIETKEASEPANRTTMSQPVVLDRQAVQEPACPACGVLGALLKRKDGGITCWSKRQGCGATWPAGTAFPPTQAPSVEPSPLVTPGAEDCEVAGCWGGANHPGAHVFDTDAEALKTPPQEATMPTFKPFGGKTEITTAGMTREQFEQSARLAKDLDKRDGKDTARTLLAAMLGVPFETATRKDLNEAQAAEYLLLLEQALGPVAP